MAYDIVTWSPRVGSTGDDAYNIPGATKIDGSVDTGAQTPIDAGDISGFDTTPSIDQLNACSHLNQAIGLYNMRVANWNAQTGGTSLVLAPYVSIGSFMDPRLSFVDGIYGFRDFLQAINALRTQQGFAAYPFPFSTSASTYPVTSTVELASGKPIFGYHLAHIRKALSLSGVCVLPVANWHVCQRYDNPTWGSIGTGFDFTMGAGNFSRVGKESVRLHSRTVSSYYIPSEFYAASMVSASNYTDGIWGLYTGLEPLTINLYSSDTDDHLYASSADAYRTNNLESQIVNPVANTPLSWAIATARVKAKAGACFSLIMGSDAEVNGYGGAPTAFALQSLGYFGGTGHIPAYPGVGRVTVDFGA